MAVLRFEGRPVAVTVETVQGGWKEMSVVVADRQGLFLVRFKIPRDKEMPIPLNEADSFEVECESPLFEV